MRRANPIDWSRSPQGGSIMLLSARVGNDHKSQLIPVVYYTSAAHRDKVSVVPLGGIEELIVERNQLFEPVFYA